MIEQELPIIESVVIQSEVRFNNKVYQSNDGSEQRIIIWNDPIRTFNVSKQILRESDLVTLRAFFSETHGSHESFWYRDKSDSTATKDPLNYRGAITQGYLYELSFTEYQICKKYSLVDYDSTFYRPNDQDFSYYRMIALPYDIAIYEDDVLVTNYTLGDNGKVVFDDAPSGELTISFKFYVPVRFDVDDLEREIKAKQTGDVIIYSLPKLVLKEIKIDFESIVVNRFNEASNYVFGVDLYIDSTETMKYSTTITEQESGFEKRYREQLIEVSLVRFQQRKLLRGQELYYLIVFWLCHRGQARFFKYKDEYEVNRLARFESEVLSYTMTSNNNTYSLGELSAKLFDSGSYPAKVILSPNVSGSNWKLYPQVHAFGTFRNKNEQVGSIGQLFYWRTTYPLRGLSGLTWDSRTNPLYPSENPNVTLVDSEFQAMNILIIPQDDYNELDMQDYMAQYSGYIIYMPPNGPNANIAGGVGGFGYDFILTKFVQVRNDAFIYYTSGYNMMLASTATEGRQIKYFGSVGSMLTICHICYIETPNGDKYGFTTHDRRFVIDDVTYSPVDSVNSQNLERELNITPNTQELKLLILPQNIQNSRIVTGVVDWMRLPVSLDEISGHRRQEGVVGEIGYNGIYYSVENISKSASILRQGKSVKTSPICRWNFCDRNSTDNGCKLNVGDHTFYTQVSSIIDWHQFQVEGEFTNLSYGVIIFTSGNNAGLELAIYRGTVMAPDTEVILQIYPDKEVQIGDDVTIIRGCERTEQACRSYENIINFGGWQSGSNFMPGNNFYYRSSSQS